MFAEQALFGTGSHRFPSALRFRGKTWIDTAEPNSMECSFRDQ